MKGMTFNLLEEVVTAEYGEDTWDVLLDRSGAGGAYTSLGSYADDELMKLVGAASEALELPPDTVVRWFGSGLCRSWPSGIQGSSRHTPRRARSS